MKLLRYGPLGQERPAVEHEGAVFSLTSLTGDIEGAFLADERIGSPIARPSAVICVGQNYAAHAEESGHAPPTMPILFLKTPNTVVGPFDDVLIPPDSTKTDWEVELAVVVGRRASYLSSPEQALAHIAGYTVSNDVTEREWQMDLSGGQWSKGKCAPTFNPLGPYLVPADELDAANLRLGSTVNGSVRQDSSTSDMIFDVPYLVWHISQFMALEPGDLINTGTPQGVALSGRFPYLRDGDEMTMTVQRIGHQTQAVWQSNRPT